MELATSSEVDLSQVYFLITDFLTRHSPCSESSKLLQQELKEKCLLNMAVDWSGKQRPATYTDFRLRYQNIPDDHLVKILSKATTSLFETEDKYISSTIEERLALGRKIIAYHQQLRNLRKTRQSLEFSIQEHKSDTMEDHVQSDDRISKQLEALTIQYERLSSEVIALVRHAEQLGMRRPVRSNQLAVLGQREVGLNIRQACQPKSFTYSRYRKQKILSGHLQIPAYCLAFGKKSRIAVTGADDRLAKVWSTLTGKLLFTLRGHMGNITDLAINHDNSVVATSSDDKTVRVWELATGFPIAVLVGHTSVINSVVFHPACNTLVSASDDGTCRVWDLPVIRGPNRKETRAETVTRLTDQHVYLLNLTARLVLSHSIDDSDRRGKVNCMDFCPSGNYLITGADDGLVRVWTISELLVLQQPVHHTEDNSSNWIQPVALLRGHTAPITTIFFSRSGTAIATASIKDGTCRLWRWSGAFENCTHLVLDSTAGEEELEHRGNRTVRPSVDMVMWTCDDQRLVTLHSVKPRDLLPTSDWKQTVKVWDPRTGQLLRILRAIDANKDFGHTNAAFCMDVHPTNWRIIMTAGYDGRMLLWDIEAGHILAKYVNMDPQSNYHECTPYLDGSFSPDGNILALTDRAGRLLIYSTGSGEAYQTSPPEQYFISDYSGIEVDLNMNVIDRMTQQPPHLMAPGELTNVMRIAYEYQPNRVVEDHDDRSEGTPYEKHRRKLVKQTMLMEEKFHCGPMRQDPVLEDFPRVCIEPHFTSTPEPPSVINGGSVIRLNDHAVSDQEAQRINSTAAEAPRRRRPASAVDTEVERDTSILNIEISSDEDDDDEDFQAADVGVADREDDEDEDSSDSDSESDSSDTSGRDRVVERSGPKTRSRIKRTTRKNTRPAPQVRHTRSMDARNSSKRRRIVVDSSSEDGDDDDAEEEQKRPCPSSDTGSSMGASPKHILDEFNTETTYDEILEERQSSGASSSSGSQILCALCGTGDDGATFPLPGSVLGPHPVMLGSQHVFVHDQCAINSPLCFRQDGKWFNIAKEIRRGRSLKCSECKTRGATIGCHLEECVMNYHFRCALSTGWNAVDPGEFYCPTHRAVEPSGGSSDPDTDIENAAKRMGLNYDRDWLQAFQHVEGEDYAPQVGDSVIYFCQSDTKTVPQLDYCSVRGIIERVQYTFPLVSTYPVENRILTTLTIRVTGLPLISSAAMFVQAFQSPEEILEFELIDYSPVEDSSCLVLEDHYLRSVSKEWQVGDEVNVPFVDAGGSHMYTGTIDSIDPSRPKSAWNALAVKWHHGSEEMARICPWEATPLQPTTCITSVQQNGLFQGIDNIMQLSVAQDFNQPVDDSVPHYFITIANPIDLGLIRKRIEHGYYRRSQSLIEDAKLLACNCEKYNVRDSGIAQNARAVRNAIFTMVQQICPEDQEQIVSNVPIEPLQVATEALSARMELYSKLCELHDLVMESDTVELFSSPVTDDIAPGYSNIIQHPMDFGTMKDKLAEYTTREEYLDDLQLVFQNARLYNEPDTFVCNEADRMEELVWTHLDLPIPSQHPQSPAPPFETSAIVSTPRTRLRRQQYVPHSAEQQMESPRRRRRRPSCDELFPSSDEDESPATRRSARKRQRRQRYTPEASSEEEDEDSSDDGFGRRKRRRGPGSNRK